MLIEVASGIAVFPGGVLTEKSYITCYFAEAGLRRIQISILMLVTAIIMWRYKKHSKKNPDARRHPEFSLEIMFLKGTY